MSENMSMDATLDVLFSKVSINKTFGAKIEEPAIPATEKKAEVPAKPAIEGTEEKLVAEWKKVLVSAHSQHLKGTAFANKEERNNDIDGAFLALASSEDFANEISFESQHNPLERRRKVAQQVSVMMDIAIAKGLVPQV